LLQITEETLLIAVMMRDIEGIT